MPKPKPRKIFNVKLSEEQHRYITLTAKAQGHCNKSLVVQRLIDREREAR
jgi:predicted HicB family RNase H-like nuclease